MIINQHNYEEYLLRKLEGLLSSKENAALDAFMRGNPDVEAEWKMLQQTVLVPDEEIVFSNKELLKVNLHNYNELLIKKLEGVLSREERNALDAEMKLHPALKTDWKVLQKTILVADERITFPDKKSLKKPEPRRVVPLYRNPVVSMSVAASLLLVVYLSIFRFGALQQPQQPVNLASNNAASSAISQPDNATSIASVSNGTVTDNSVNTTQSSKLLASVNRSSVEALAVNTPYIQQTPTNLVAKVEMTSLPRRSSKPFPVSEKQTYARYEPSYNSSPAPRQSHATGPLSWLQVASVVGSELYRLSGRGELFPNNPEIKKQMEVLRTSIQTNKFAFYKKISLHKKHKPHSAK